MIQVFKPYYDEKEEQAVIDALRSGWVGLGPKTKEFEDKFAQYIGAKYCVGLNSCTAALDMALKLLDIHHGDKVIVPTMTFVSTAHAVVYNHAIPIFVDCDENTLGMNLEDVKKKITKRTKAIITVHYGGHPIDLDKLKEIANKIPIIEDCAHAAGAYYKNKHVGSDNIGCFSFHAVKNLAMGEGGCISLNNEEFYERAKKLRWLGIDKGTWDRTENDKSYWWQYCVNEIGLKSHLNDIHAAIGLVQLEKLKESNNKRKKIIDLYRKSFIENKSKITMLPEDDEIFKSSWHLCEIKCEKRDELSIFLRDNGINIGVHYKPIHLYKCYGNKPDLPISQKLFKEILTLPLYPGLNEKEVDYIINKIVEFYKVN